jgi:hypothetical protein
MRYEEGMHRAGFGRLIERGATMEAFEMCIGPIEEIEARWYHHLRDLRGRLAGQVTPCVRLRPGEASGDIESAIEESEP